MTKPMHVTVGKAILTLVENPEVFGWDTSSPPLVAYLGL
jgi:hypothetical protein